jgi:alkylation response protein AidB-like acyl-CoA dehydrogenase
MRVELPDDYYEFGESVAHLLAREWSARDLRDYWDGDGTKLRSLWSSLASLGVFALTVPIESGGEGRPVSSVVPVLETAGRCGLPHPIAETVAVAAPTLAETDSPLAENWLARIATGQAIVTVQDGWDAIAPWGSDADLVLVLDRSDHIHLCSPAPAEGRLASTDPSRRLAPVDRSAVIETLTAPGLGHRARARATAATAVVLTGSAFHAVHLAVDYAKVRKQFGRTIGSFQAIKHLLADSYFRVETNRRVAWVAKLNVGEAAQQASYAALQVHGSIGYTWECDLHLWLKRIQVLNNSFGTPAEHARRLAVLYSDGHRVGLARD